MKRLLLLLLLCSPASAQSVKVPAEVRVDPKEWAVVTYEADGGPVRFMLPDRGLTEIPLESLLGKETAEKARCRIFKSSVPGRYRVWAVTAKAREGDQKIADVSEPAQCWIIVGQSPEPEPVPPGPTPPGPTPPGPTPPTPGPAPIPAEGLHVLIVYETGDLSKLPQSQLSVLYSQEVRDYLISKCVLGPDGKTSQFRVWDQHVETASEAPTWKNAMARQRTTLPWIVISNGKAGYEGPLPLTIGDTLTLLKKYGG